MKYTYIHDLKDTVLRAGRERETNMSHTQGTRYVNDESGKLIIRTENTPIAEVLVIGDHYSEAYRNAVLMTIAPILLDGLIELTSISRDPEYSCIRECIDEIQLKITQSQSRSFT
jgi:hypothetical protein